MTASTWLILIGLHLLSLAAAVAITAWATRCDRPHVPGVERLWDVRWTDHTHRTTWIPRVSGRRTRPAMVRHPSPSGVDTATREIPSLRGGAR